MFGLAQEGKDVTQNRLRTATARPMKQPCETIPQSWLRMVQKIEVALLYQVGIIQLQLWLRVLVRVRARVSMRVYFPFHE